MNKKAIIDELNNAPRYGRPEFGKTVVITEKLCKEVVKALESSTTVTRKNRRVPGHIGATPQ